MKFELSLLALATRIVISIPECTYRQPNDTYTGQILRIPDAHDFASVDHVPLGHFLHLAIFLRWCVRNNSCVHASHVTLQPVKVTLV